MGLVCLRNLCLILIFIISTCNYISAFRLIHTSEDKEIKKDIKEHVRKPLTQENLKNQTIHLHLKPTESETKIKQELPTLPDKKIKTVPPTLPSEITKQKIKERLKSISIEDDDSQIDDDDDFQIDDDDDSQIDDDDDDDDSQIDDEDDEDDDDDSEIDDDDEPPKVNETSKIKHDHSSTKESPKIKLITKHDHQPPKDTPKIQIIKKHDHPIPKIQLTKKTEEVKPSVAPKIKIISKHEHETPKEALKIKVISKHVEEIPKVKIIKKSVEEKSTEAPKTKIIKIPDEEKPKIKIIKKDIEEKPKEPSKIKIIKKDIEEKPKEPPKIKIIKKENEEKPKEPPKIKIIKKDIEEKPKEPPKIKIIKKENEEKPKEPPKIKIIKKDNEETPKLKKEIVKEPPKPKTIEEKPKPKESAPKTPKIEPKVSKPKREEPKKIDKVIPSAEYVKKDPDNILNLLYSNVPSFSPNFDILENEECKKQGAILLDQLHQHKLWALKMFDSNAKIPPSILRGNLNQFGDYDQCVGIFAKIPTDDFKDDVKISGKYCLANIDIEADLKDMRLPVHLAQGRAMIRSKLQDPGHFIPRFTTIRWGICIPSACTSEDAEKILENNLKIYNDSQTVGLHFDISIDSDQCYIRKAPKQIWDLPLPTLITIFLNAFLVILVLIATLRDFHFSYPEEKAKESQIQDETTLEKLFMSFSLKRTSKSLLKKESEPDEIECIHGIRTICTLLLYIAHKLIPVGHLPFLNKTTLTEISNNPLSVILRLSVIYTDSFLLLSGILTSFRMSKDIEEKGYIPWFNRILARFIRLTPSLLFILLYYAYVMEFLGDGPLWNTIITPNAQLCKDNWWQNVLYVQNFYPFQDMCATHTHQLALDMQLSLIAPILVWLLYRKPLLGVTTTLLLHLVSLILRYYTTINYRLSLVIYHGISISQLYRTANYLYASAIHRATPYLAGIALGVLLRQIKPNFYMPKILGLFGWLIAGYFAGWSLYSPSHLSSKTYQYEINEAAQFSALCSLAWSLALSWVIFACFADNEGYLNKFLSSRPMVLLSRISYTFYLTQFIVFFYNVGTVRNSTEFKINTSLDLTEMIIILIISTLLTLFIDLPVQKIKSILMRSILSSSKRDKQEEIETTTKNNISKVSVDNQENDIHKLTNDKDNTEELLDEEEYEVENTKKLVGQLSTESQMSEEIEDEDYDIHETSGRKVTFQLSTESQLSVDEEHFDDHDDLSEHLTSQLSVDEEHDDLEEEETDKSLTIQLSMDEEHFSEDEIVPKDFTGSQKSDEEEKVEQEQEDEDIEEENVQKITIRLSSDGKMSVQKQIEEILDEEDKE